MLICDSILEDYKAQEIAHDKKMDEQEAAATWFRETMEESGFSEQDQPAYCHFLFPIDAQTDLWWDFGANYYFAVRKQ